MIIDKREIKKVRLILNPIAGTSNNLRRLLRRIKTELNTADPDLQLKISLTGDSGDALLFAKEAVEEGYEMVITVGGDGTINEVVNGLVGSNTILGAIPLGTANVFAEELGIPINIEGACKLLLTGRIHRVDLGKIEDRYFLWIAGIGLDAYIAEHLAPIEKENLGIFAYFFFALRQLRKLKSYQVKIRINGKSVTRDALCIIVGNAASYSSPLEISALSSISDGYLDILLFKRLTLSGIFRSIFWFTVGRRTYYRDVKYFDIEYFKVKDAFIDTYPKALAHADGEVVGTVPVNVTIFPKSLSIILPD